MWVYNNKKIKSLHRDLNQLTDKLIKDRYADEYFELVKTAKILYKRQAEACGEKADSKALVGMVQDLNYRLGNAVLQQIRNYDTVKNKLDYNTSKKIKKGKRFTKKGYKNNRELQYAFNKILNTTEAELK